MKTYIIHVSDAYDRENHMQKQLKNKGLEINFINEGDIKELNTSLINEYFIDNMASLKSATSCAYKHIMAYKKISEGKDDLALVLEDDILFYSNYFIINGIIKELKERKIKNFILSLEDSNLKYIPKSERTKEVMVYPRKEGRLAGAYLIDKEGAKNILAYIKKEKTNLPIDWFHNLCVHNEVINMFWNHPAIAVQGSLDGSIKSLIDSKKYGILRIWSFRLQRVYKKLLYQLR